MQSEDLRNLRILRLRNYSAQSSDCANYAPTARTASNKGMEGDKVTVAETTCASASERFNYLAHQHVDGVDGGQHVLSSPTRGRGGGQHGVVSTALCQFFTISSGRTFHTLSVKHMVCT